MVVAMAGNSSKNNFSKEGARREKFRRDPQRTLLFDGPATVEPAPAVGGAKGGPTSKNTGTSARPWPEAPEVGASQAVADLPTRETVKPGSIAEKWLNFHEANPLIFDDFATRAVVMRQEEIAAGVPVDQVRLYPKAIWDLMRKDLNRTNRGRRQNLNNNYVPYYARLAVKHHPFLASCFKFREQKSQE